MNPREILRQSSELANAGDQAREGELTLIEQVLAENTAEARGPALFIAQCLTKEGTETDFQVGEYQKTWFGRQRLAPTTLAGCVISEIGRYYDTSSESWCSAFGNGLLTDGRYITYNGNSPLVSPQLVVGLNGENIPSLFYDPYIHSKSRVEILRRTGREINNLPNHQAEQITRAMSIRDTLDSFGRHKLPPRYYR